MKRLTGLLTGLSFCASVYAQAPLNITLESTQNLYNPTEGFSTTYGNIWGYTDSLGNEYAIIGAYSGTSIVNVTDPANPVEVDTVTAPASAWHEEQVWQQYAYSVSEGGSGLQIINLSLLPDSVFLVKNWLWSGSTADRAHAFHIRDGYAYLTGGTVSSGQGGHQGGIRILSLADPENPVTMGYWDSLYVHDCYVRNDTIYAACIFDGVLAIIDVKDKANPHTIYAYTWPNAFTHNAALSEDGQYLLTTDETTSPPGRLRIWDIRTIRDGIPNNTNIEQLAQYGSTGIVHNVYVNGPHAYASYYSEGVRVWDIRNPRNPILVGQYDTYPADNAANYNGNWGVFPFFKFDSLNNTQKLILSDRQRGLYVLSFTPPSVGFVRGTVRDQATLQPLANVVVTLGNYSVSTDSTGAYLVNDVYGSTTLGATRSGYISSAIQLTIHSADTVVNVDLSTSSQLPPRIRTVVLQNPAASQYADIVVTSEDSLSGAPVVHLKSGTDSSLVSMTAVNAGLTYRGAVKFSSAGTYSIRTQATSLHAVDSIAYRGFTVTLSKAKGYTLVRSETGKAVLKIPEGAIRAGTYVVAEEEDGVIRFGPDIGFERPVTVELPYTTEMEMSKSFVYQREGTTWTRLATVRLSRSEVLKAETVRMGEFKVVSDPTYENVEVGDFRLAPNFPNPFNPSTTLQYELPEDSEVRLEVYNMLGQRVRTLTGGFHTAGQYRILWDGRNDHDAAVASGVYLVRLQADRFMQTRKILLVK